MRSPRIRSAAWLALLCTACAPTWDPQALAFRQPAASVSAHALKRPRFVYAPASAGGKLRAGQISVQLTDARNVAIATSTLPALARAGARRAPVEIHASSEARASERLALLISGQGPALRVEGRVTELDVLENDDQDLRLISASIDWVLRDGAGQVLHAGRSRGGFEIQGAPHDPAELDELHVGAVLSALDHFLAKPEVVELVNLKVAGQAVPPNAL